MKIEKLVVNVNSPSVLYLADGVEVGTKTENQHSSTGNLHQIKRSKYHQGLKQALKHSGLSSDDATYEWGYAYGQAAINDYHKHGSLLGMLTLPEFSRMKDDYPDIPDIMVLRRARNYYWGSWIEGFAFAIADGLEMSRDSEKLKTLLTQVIDTPHEFRQGAGASSKPEVTFFDCMKDQTCLTLAEYYYEERDPLKEEVKFPELSSFKHHLVIESYARIHVSEKKDEDRTRVFLYSKEPLTFVLDESALIDDEFIVNS